MIAGAILLALVCWGFTFGIAWGNFWLKIGAVVITICLYSLFWQRPNLRFTRISIVWGVLSAVALYGVFYVGNSLAFYIVAGANAQVSGIYNLGVGTDRILIFLLLSLVTGPGEEIFWRGFLQGNLMRRIGDFNGFAMSTFIYAGVHVFSFNLMLIAAAFVAGAFWGALYLWKRDLGMVIISHSVWSACIFAVLPIH